MGCNAVESSDRTVLILQDRGTGQDQKHLAFGRDRIVQTTSSSDGNWAISVVKARGREEYVAMLLDLAHCKSRQTLDIPGRPNTVTFSLDAATLAFAEGQKSISLLEP